MVALPPSVMVLGEIDVMVQAPLALEFVLPDDMVKEYVP
jgi:hypothetical protein